MSQPIPLSGLSSSEANTTFNHWLNTERVALIVVFGDDKNANDAVSLADQKINSDDAAYKGFRVIQAPKPGYILNTIRNLKLPNGHVPVDWGNLQDYILMSISEKYNNIGQVISRTEYLTGPAGSINLAAVFARAVDKNQ